MILSHVMLIAICVLFVEITLRGKIPRSMTEIVAVSSKSKNVIVSKAISDHWKEKVIPIYALALFRNSLKIVGLFAFLLLVFLVMAAINPTLLDLTLSYAGIAESLVVAYLYFKLRKIMYE